MKLLVSAATVWCALATPAVAQPMSSTDIERAITVGMTGKEGTLRSRCQATRGGIETFLRNSDLHPDGEHFHVVVTLTAGRIASLAAAAKRLYKTFQPADVPQHLRVNAVFVEGEPHEPRPSVTVIPPPIEHVVLKGNNGRAIQPDHLKTERIADWPGTAGSKDGPNKAFARFVPADVEELPAGHFDVVLITAGGERRCKVGEDDRERIFGDR